MPRRVQHRDYEHARDRRFCGLGRTSRRVEMRAICARRTPTFKRLLASSLRRPTPVNARLDGVGRSRPRRRGPWLLVRDHELAVARALFAVVVLTAGRPLRLGRHPWRSSEGRDAPVQSGRASDDLCPSRPPLRASLPDLRPMVNDRRHPVAVPQALVHHRGKTCTSTPEGCVCVRTNR